MALACAVAGFTPAAGQARADAAAGSVGGAPVRHVIEIMLENHTFDNLFPGGASGGRQPLTAPPNEGDVQGGIDNGRAAELKAMDYQPGRGYLMDRYTDPPFGPQAITTFGAGFDPNLQYLASGYELAAGDFQPVIGPTGPNVLAALTGSPGGPQHSIFDELTAHGRSWKIYYALPPAILRGTFWQQIIPPGHAAGLTTGNQFFADLADGHLPDFSFVRPGIGYSEEPREDIGQGDAWLGQLVAAVARSRYWPSTAIFVTYDEGGGFADHVPPPVAKGYGTRIPLVIVSPWARPGVYHRRSTTLSVLSFMQHLWGLPPLTQLNRIQNDLAGAFDFGQQPLAPPQPPVAPADTIGLPRPDRPAGGARPARAPLAHHPPGSRDRRADTGPGAVRAGAAHADPTGRGHRADRLPGQRDAGRGPGVLPCEIPGGRLLPGPGRRPGRQPRLDHDCRPVTARRSPGWRRRPGSRPRRRASGRR